MSTSTLRPRRDTRVFISAVTRELGSVRKLVKKGLEDNDYHAVEQDSFPPDYRKLVDKLRGRIASCDAMVHIAGHCYGSEPISRPEGEPRRSYTQLEYDLAVELGKPVYVFLTGDGFPTDPHTPEEFILTQLQLAHRERLTSTGHDYCRPATREELDQKIRSLQLKVEGLQDELTHAVTSGQRLGQFFVIALIASVLLIGGLAALMMSEVRLATRLIPEDVGRMTGVQLDKATEVTVAEVRRIYADPDVLVGVLKSHIRRRAAEEIGKARSRNSDWRQIEAIEKQRDQALSHIEELVNKIREGLVADADPVFTTAALLLAEKGILEAIDYLESKKPETLDQVDRLINQKDRVETEIRLRLGQLHLQAELREANFQWNEALALYEEVVAKDPTWFEARILIGEVLQELSRVDDAEAHFRVALATASNQAEKAIALNNLAQVFELTDRRADAEEYFCRALIIDEQHYGPGHVNVAIRLNNLAHLLKETSRLKPAELCMRRAVAIDERERGADDPHVAILIDGLAALLESSGRTELVKSAEHLKRHALRVSEMSYGSDDPRVAVFLNNLGQLLALQERTPEAALVTLRAIAIHEKAYGPMDPHIARCLSNLVSLLHEWNFAVDCEPLMRRALIIDLAAFGKLSSRVAVDCNNLALVLRSKGNGDEAESLLRQALAIDEHAYRVDHPLVALRLCNLADLLLSTGRAKEAERLVYRSLIIYAADERLNGNRHVDFSALHDGYLDLLRNLQIPDDEIDSRMKSIADAAGPFDPIVPEVRRMLGPGQSIADVLDAQNRRYKSDGKPDVYFLTPDQPVTPHLERLLKPRPDSLYAEGLLAYGNDEHANSIIIFDEAIKLLEENPELGDLEFLIRMNRAAALRELGLVEQARDELQLLVAGFDNLKASSPLEKGRARYHLALCLWRLEDRDAAKSEADNSLNAYGTAPSGFLGIFGISEEEEVVATYRSESQKLLAAIAADNRLIPAKKADTDSLLEQARAHFRRRVELAELPLYESSSPLLDKLLGPSRSTNEVFEILDQVYHEQNRPPVWFLPLTAPITPYLDDLLGPLPDE